MKFAVTYVWAGMTRVAVVDAADRDEAYEVARDAFMKAKKYTAAIQGAARPASQNDIDAAKE